MPSIQLRSNNCIRFVPLAQICSIEASTPYTYVHMLDGSKLFAGHKIGQLENRLEQHGFLRLERSWLVNLHNVTCYEAEGNGVLKLANGQRLHLPRGKKRELQRALDGVFL